MQGRAAAETRAGALHEVRVGPEAARRRGAPFGPRREARGPAQRLALVCASRTLPPARPVHGRDLVPVTLGTLGSCQGACVRVQGSMGPIPDHGR